jgi:Flp pilus assembly pilin Flp
MMDVILWSVVQGQNAWARLRDEERGQGLVEYALIIAVVALGVILALIFLKDRIEDLFTRAGTELASQPS